jgi:adenylate kinase
MTRKMKTRSFHYSNFGTFATLLKQEADSAGYVEIHDDLRYENATKEQLDKWTASPKREVRAATLTELAQRELDRWRCDR